MSMNNMSMEATAKMKEAAKEVMVNRLVNDPLIDKSFPTVSLYESYLARKNKKRKLVAELVALFGPPPLMAYVCKECNCKVNCRYF